MKWWSTPVLVASCLCCAALLLCGSTPAKAEIVADEDKGNLELTSDEATILDILGSIIGLSSSEVHLILSLTKMGLGLLEGLESIFVKVFNGTSLDLNFVNLPQGDKQLLSMFEIISIRLEQIQRGTEGAESSLRDIARGLPYLVRWEIALDTFEEYTHPINSLFHRFTYYQRHKNEVEDHTLIDFAENVVSHSTTSVQALMANIHSMVAPSDPPVLKAVKLKRRFDKDEYEVHSRVSSLMSTNYVKLLSKRGAGEVHNRDIHRKMAEMSLRPSVFRMLEDAIQNYDSCNYKQSPQQLVFGLYTQIALTLARGYSMISFSYNILKFHNEGNFTIERQLAAELYKHYSQGLVSNALQVLKRSSNAFLMCDPSHHVLNETYVMVTELLQGYIENEVDLNSGGTCTNKCSSYKHSKVEGCYLPNTQYCGKHRRCEGNVHECRFFDADATVCISSVPYRRYDWILYEDKQSLGQRSSCDNKMKVDSWWRFFYHCSYCVCLCDDPNSPTSDRYISLRPVVSDVAEGMMVTGLRFAKKDRVIHMQVQQGKASPQGQVDPASIYWVPVDPISVEDTQTFVDDVDYVTLKYEARNVDLDYLEAPKRHVVTGVKFRTLGTHVNLEVWVTPINFTTGVMSPNMSFWISNDQTPVNALNPRTQVHLYRPDVSTRSNSDSEEDSSHNSFVTLQETSLRADVSQLTVPFFDAQEVSPRPSTWLEGVQLYHRGRTGYGGFLGFKVFSYNFLGRFQDELDEGVIR